MKPTWEGWDEVLEAQDADVSSTSPCLYQGHWDHDYRDWIPQILNTGLTWDVCTNVVSADVELSMVNTIIADEHDFWRPKGQESTQWYPVQFPN